MDVGDIWWRVIHFCQRDGRDPSRDLHSATRSQGWITQQKIGSRKKHGEDDENEASKLLCGCNYQGGRRDRPASLRLMHHHQPYYYWLFPFIFYSFKKKDGPRDFSAHRRTVFFESLDGELRAFLKILINHINIVYYIRIGKVPEKKKRWPFLRKWAQLWDDDDSFVFDSNDNNNYT